MLKDRHLPHLISTATVAASSGDFKHEKAEV